MKFAASGVSAHSISMDSFGTQQGQQYISFSGSTEWEYKQLLYTPPQGVQYVRISFWNSTAADYYIDDAVIRENARTQSGGQSRLRVRHRDTMGDLEEP
ncbi:hypothetical protein D3C75_505730 [compost metagenome]